MTTTRREFLIASLSGIGASLLGVGCGDLFSKPRDDGGGPPPKQDRDSLPETTLSLEQLVAGYFDGAETADVKLLGETYLRRFGDDVESANDDLSETVELVASIEQESEALTEWDRAVVEDFEATGIASIAGWQLARTESRLAGLAYYLL